MLVIEMLPARQGDALLISYGSPDRLHQVLVDGGTFGTRAQLRKRLVSRQGVVNLEALVVTHIDADHIGGVLGLLTDRSISFEVRDVWFNGWRHLPGSSLESLGPVQGERLTQRLLQPDLSWNGDYKHESIAVPDAGGLPVKDLPGGLKLTLLSPGREQLRLLRAVWEKEVRAAGLDPGGLAQREDEEESTSVSGLERLGPPRLPDVEALATTPFEPDAGAANGSSIALLAEYDERRLLLSGDAHAGVLQSTIDRIVGKGRPLEVDVFKLPHHGSSSSVSRELIERVQCRNFLFSSNGARFGHPHLEAVSRVILASQKPPTLVFNYRSAYNQIWEQPILVKRYGYSTLYPIPGSDGLRFEVCG